MPVTEVVDRDDVDTGDGSDNVAPFRRNLILVRDVQADDGLAQVTCDVGALGGAEEVSPDSPESVDRYLHSCLLVVIVEWS